MELKRPFKGDDGKTRVGIMHTGTHPEQNFSGKMVARGIADGWLSIVRGILVLHADPEDLTYKILRGPGRHCLHCGAVIENDPKGNSAREHMAKEHPGLASPDPQWPHGYKVVDGYECVLAAAQHEKFNFHAVRERKRAPAPKAEV